MSFESLSFGKRIVVIGGVAAGLSAASKARRLSSDIEILGFEKSDHISYVVRAFVPQIKGIEIKGIFTINTLQDGIETKDFIRKNVPKGAIIVGSGHIEMEMAEALVMAGMDVTIAEREPDILGTMDEEITKIVEEGLGRNNVKLLKSTSVREFIGKNGYVMEAILENSESINVDIVIVCSSNTNLGD